MRRIPSPDELKAAEERRRAAARPMDSMGTPTYIDPLSALHDLDPKGAEAFEAARQAIIRLLDEHLGLAGSTDYLAAMPEDILLHQAAGSAIVDLVTTTDTISSTAAAKRIAAANNWFSAHKFLKYTNRVREQGRKAAARKARRDPPLKG